MSEEFASKKYEKAKLLFEKELINNFKELFDILPYSVIAKKINTNHLRLKAKLENPMTLKLYEIKAIAEIINIDPVALFALALQSSPVHNEEV